MEKILNFLFLSCLILSSNIYADNSDYYIKIPLQRSKISLDPSHVQDISSLFVSRQINCQLARMQGSKFFLEAAKSVKYVSPLEIIVQIKENIYFNDGSPVNAEDVVASFEYVKKSRTVLRNIFLWVDKISIINEKTISFSLKNPAPKFLTVLSSPNYAIFKKSFLDKAKKDNQQWKNPVGCGGYKIGKYDDNKISLIPVKKTVPIVFYVNKRNQIHTDEINKYDIIGLNIIGNNDELKKFNLVEIFDPLQFYLGLNLNRKKWKNKLDRCSFLSKLNRQILLGSYGSMANLSNDFFPQGTFGYSGKTNFFANEEIKYKKIPAHKMNDFCLAYLSVSVPEEYRDAYIKMIKTVIPVNKTMLIVNSKKFGLEFSKKKCDAFVFALKSNYLDGYEYLNILANDDADFSGIGKNIFYKDIEESQNLTNPHEKIKKYREIVDRVEDACMVRPLITIPMRSIYVRKTINAPEIGLGPLNEYYLGNVTILNKS